MIFRKVITSSGQERNRRKKAEVMSKKYLRNTTYQTALPYKKSKPKNYFWRYGLLSLFLIFLILGALAVLRFSLFTEATFGGRNEPSLLYSTNPQPAVVPPTGLPASASGSPTPAIVALPNTTASVIFNLIPAQATPTASPAPSPSPATVASSPSPTQVPASPTSTVALPTNTVVPPTNTPVPTPVVAPTATPKPLPIPPPAGSIMERIERGDRISLLMLGYGGAGHDGPYLSDTILQVVYDPAKKAVTMINIPRDLYAFIPYGGNGVGYWGKINQAFSYVMNMGAPAGNLSKRYNFKVGNEASKVDAAATLAKDTVEQVTGIPVDYWMAVNFDGFIKLIDSIGGIDVVVDKAFYDPTYPTRDDSGQLRPLNLTAGPHHMAGHLAIAYARSRYSLQENGDISRSKRQMKVIQAVKTKILQPDILLKAPGIIEALQGNLRISVSFEEALALGNFLNGDQGRAYVDNLYFLPQVIEYNFLNAASNEQGFVFIPKTGQGNYSAIRDWLHQGLLAPQLRGEDLLVQVQNATGEAKYGPQANQMLANQGFNLIALGNAPPGPTRIIDYTGGKGPETLKLLQSDFPGVEVKATAPPKGYTGPDIVVVLGVDYPK